MAVLIHGFVLAADYEPFDGTLLRSGADAWQFIFLPVAHLAFICGLVWVYTHAQLTGSRARQGLTLGVLGWMMGQVPRMAAVVRGTAMARIARREAAWARARLVAGDRIHDRLHRAAIGVCAGLALHKDEPHRGRLDEIVHVGQTSQRLSIVRLTGALFDLA